jgi:anaerobic selenocysteine-containing dehydrogenase
MCHGICGVLVHVRDGRVVKVVGDRERPSSKGYICPKGRASVEYIYHPDRLRHPLKRVGERGENRWQRISWDEALDTIAGRLAECKEKFGAESFVLSRGTGRPYSAFNLRFTNAFGTPNQWGNGHICYIGRVQASKLTCGQLPICDFYGFGGVYPQCVVVWGCNIAETHASDGMCGGQLVRAYRRGAKLIVIDPRRTSTAARADLWAQIRPGTDAALALAMIHTIIEEGLYDQEFVEQWTVGFDQLWVRARDYPPERVEEITWVPAQTIREMARLYATTKPACLLWGNAVDQSASAFQTARALLILRGITGNIDVPGGDVLWVPPEGVVQTSPFMDSSIVLPEALPPEQATKRLPGTWPHNFCDAVLESRPYPVKALLNIGANPLVTSSDCLRLEAALKKVDFIAAIDLFMTPTTQLADIVLPAASWLEQDDIADLHFIWCVQVRQKVVEIEECRDDKEILMELARRLGIGHHFPWRNVREYCDWVLRDSGITFDEFKEMGIITGKMRYRKYLSQGFATRSGKFELYCSALEERGHDPLPSYTEPPESPLSTPELAQEYPLIAITGCKLGGFFHSEGRQVKSLRRLHPEPLVEIHPDTAEKLGIQDGDWVWIQSPRGRIRQRARLTAGIYPRVIHAQHGWWFPEGNPPEYGYKEFNPNLLLDNQPCEPVMGAEAWKGFLCRIYKAR